MAAALVIGLSTCGGQDSIEVATPSLARLAGTACLKPILATAVAVEDGLLLTVAHAVAGADDDLRAIDVGGTELGAVIVAFDPERDLALLRVDGFHDPITLAVPEPEGAGTIAAVDGDLAIDAIPYEIIRVVGASSGDIYDQGQVLRQTIEIDAQVGPGDSGAPLLDETGAMVGLLFAESEGIEGSAWALHISEIEAFLSSPRSDTEVDRGRCR